MAGVIGFEELRVSQQCDEPMPPVALAKSSQSPDREAALSTPARDNPASASTIEEAVASQEYSG